MSLLKRIESGSSAPPRPPVDLPQAPQPGSPALATAEAPAPPPVSAAPAPPLPPAAPSAATRQASPAAERASAVSREIKSRVKTKLIAELDPNLDPKQANEIRQRLQSLFDQIVDGENIILTRAERQRLFEEIAADVIGFGPIQPLLDDDSITEVMVNGPTRVYVESRGKLRLSDVAFEDDEHVRRIIDRIVSPIGRRVDESNPICDARLPDGSRVNIVIPPISLIGSVITIRKFPKFRLGVEDLVHFGSMTPEVAEFMKACVIARLNIVVSGGTGSGKTTLLNVLSNFIPDDERIITVEDSAELQLQKDHWIRMETRPPNIEGKGAVPARDCIKASLRMRPERVIVGECRAGETLDMLQAMNTGHDGSLTTLHANTPRDALSRIETMTLYAGVDLPVRAIREQMSSALDLIVQQSRLRDGSRKITYVTEVVGMEGDIITLQDIFVFEQDAYEAGKVIGRIKPTGVRPKFMPKIEDSGIIIPASVFGISERFF